MAGVRSKNVTGQAVGLNPHQYIFAIFNAASDESDVRLLIERAFENDHPKIAMSGWKRRLTDFLDESFRPQTVADQFRDRDDLQMVVLGELDQVRHSRHRSIFLHDLADDGSRRQPCDGGEIDG